MNGSRRIPRTALAFAFMAGLLPSSARAAALRVSEFLAENRSGLRDEDGDASDWIEIHNADPAPVDLGGWALTNDPARRRIWPFPPRILPPGGYLIVFASGKDRAPTAGELHADFRLDREGEYLALLAPDGAVASAYAPYPKQRADVSYGIARRIEEVRLVAMGSAAAFLIPPDDSLGRSWTGSPENEPFDDGARAGWRAGAIGIGFDAADDLLRPIGYWDFDDASDPLLARDASGYGRDGTIASVFELRGAGGRTRPAYTPPGGGRTGRPEDRSLDFGPPGNGAVVRIGAAARGAFDSAVWRDQISISVWILGGDAQPANDYLFWAGSEPEGSGIRSLNAHLPWGDGWIYWDTAGCCDATQRISVPGGESIHWKGRWNHYVFLKDGPRKEIWRNGALLQEGVNRAPLTRIRSLFIGDRPEGNGSYGGRIDDFALWDRPLDPIHIESLARGASPLDLSSYGPLIATDVGDAMRARSASLYLRIPFDADPRPEDDGLFLSILYDDGFIAYLNGVEVAARNAPSAARSDATALSPRPREACLRAEEIDLSFAVGLLRRGRNILAIHALNAGADDPAFLILPELVLGRQEPDRYLRPPTPGGPNAAGFAGFVEELRFAPDHGLFDAPFSVEISTSTEGARIDYTLDGSEPDPSGAGSAPYRGPIPVATTTILRAVGFRDGFQPTEVHTRTYIFPAAVARQPADPPGFPATWSGGFRADYEVDPKVVGRTIEGYGFEDALRAIPTISIVADREDLFGASEGIYVNAGQIIEKPCSIELIHPDGDRGFQANAGIRIHGHTSRSHTFTPKHSLRVFFRSRHGPDRLRYPLFDGSPVERFEQFVLKGLSTDSWPVEDGWALPNVPGARRWYRERAQYLREQWMKDSLRAMGQPAAHGSFVHVYLNGLYFGLYNLTERHTDSYHADHFGGRREEYDVIHDFAQVQSGDLRAWEEMMALAAAGLRSDAAFERIQGNRPDGTRDPALPKYVDVDDLIDYMILHIAAGADDWPNHNWWAGRRRGPQSDGFRFYPWDQEISNNINNQYGWTSWGQRFELVDVPNTPAFLYARMRENPTFRRRFGDRVHMHLVAPDGALSPAASRARWMARAAEIDRAIVAESARWGDHRRAIPYTREVEWLAEQAWIRTYFEAIHATQIERFRAIGLYASLPAPLFDLPGGRIAPGTRIALTAERGEILYTLDGSDPALRSGEVSPAAARHAVSAESALLVAQRAEARILVPDGSIGGGWVDPAFDDRDWIRGSTGIGFGSEYAHLIGTDVGAAMRGIRAAVWIRIPFELDGGGPWHGLALRMKYEDGFVAFLNGEEVARDNAPEPIAWDSAAIRARADSRALAWQTFDLARALPLLRPGRNLLAIQGLNVSAENDDLLILPELEATRIAGGGIELGATAVVSARALDGGRWSALARATFFLDLPLRITEIMYHPDRPEGAPEGAEDELEFLELANVGAEVIDLAGIRLEGAVAFDFSVAGWRWLGPGETVLVVRDRDAFARRYEVRDLRIAGEYRGHLGDGGERIRLIGPLGEPLLDFAYDDSWYPETDGRGFSLVIRNAAADPDSWGSKESWRSSEVIHGTPGFCEILPPGGLVRPGDANGDGRFDLADPIRLLAILFAGEEAPLPCPGSIASPGNATLLDANADGRVDLGDAIHDLNALFAGGPPHALGLACVPIEGCPDRCAP